MMPILRITVAALACGSVSACTHAGTTPGDEDAVHVVDLVSRNGKRLAQVEVWRTDGRWHAGEWSQCVD